jgi:hypothetical protein
MKKHAWIILLTVLCTCGEKSPAEQAAPDDKPAIQLEQADILQRTVSRSEPSDIPEFSEELLIALEQIAEVERSGNWFRGLGIIESSMREEAGDFAGAVTSAYKEIAWAYSVGLTRKEDVDKTLRLILENKTEAGFISATNAALAFSRGQWVQAFNVLTEIHEMPEEPDSFVKWMLLVCVLENNREDRQAAGAYRAIRARYAHFPEYWYRGARNFSGPVAAEFAEHCIDSAANGPFAAECREILAGLSGLGAANGPAIKTKREIDEIINIAAGLGNPESLSALFPLVSLPDNPFTVYAVGRLRAIVSSQIYRDYLAGQAAVSAGRLSERLAYICRG